MRTPLTAERDKQKFTMGFSEGKKNANATWIIFHGAPSVPFEIRSQGVTLRTGKAAKRAVVVILVGWHWYYEDLSTAVDERRAVWHLHPVLSTACQCHALSIVHNRSFRICSHILYKWPAVPLALRYKTLCHALGIM